MHGPVLIHLGSKTQLGKKCSVKLLNNEIIRISYRHTALHFKLKEPGTNKHEKTSFSLPVQGFLVFVVKEKGCFA